MLILTIHKVGNQLELCCLSLKIFMLSETNICSKFFAEKTL